MIEQRDPCAQGQMSQGWAVENWLAPERLASLRRGGRRRPPLHKRAPAAGGRGVNAISRLKSDLRGKHRGVSFAGAKAGSAVPIADRVGDLAGAIGEGSITRGVVDRVKDVEHLRFNLQLHLFFDIEALAHAQVDVLEARPVDLVAAQSTIAPAVRGDLATARCQVEGGWVDPLHAGSSVRVLKEAVRNSSKRVSDDVDPRAYLIARRAAVESQHAGHHPSMSQRLGPMGRTGHFPTETASESVANIKVAVAVVCFKVVAVKRNHTAIGGDLVQIVGPGIGEL